MTDEKSPPVDSIESRLERLRKFTEDNVGELRHGWETHQTDLHRVIQAVAELASPVRGAQKARNRRAIGAKADGDPVKMLSELRALIDDRDAVIEDAIESVRRTVEHNMVWTRSRIKRLDRKVRRLEAEPPEPPSADDTEPDPGGTLRAPGEFKVMPSRGFVEKTALDLLTAALYALGTTEIRIPESQDLVAAQMEVHRDADTPDTVITLSALPHRMVSPRPDGED